jgi:uncharacterized lipoprotein YajG
VQKADWVFFRVMKKKRTPRLLILLFGVLCLAGCSENSGWQMGPEGMPLNSAPSGNQ